MERLTDKGIEAMLHTTFTTQDGIPKVVRDFKCAIRQLQGDLKTVLDRESETHSRHDIKFAAMETELTAIRADVARLTASLAGEVDAALVDSACLSFRHDFGLLDGMERHMVQFAAKEWLRAWQAALGAS